MEAQKQQIAAETETPKKELKLQLARKKLDITKQIHQKEGRMELAAKAQVDNQVESCINGSSYRKIGHHPPVP